MARFPHQHRFLITLAVATLLHALLLLIPAARVLLPTEDAVQAIHVRLLKIPPAIEDAEREAAPTESIPDLTPPPFKPVELAELPAAPAPSSSAVSSPASAPELVPVPPEPAANAAEVLSWQFDYPDRKSVFGRFREQADDRPDYYARIRPNLKDVLNEPSLQLPFADTRIYLVDSYDPGMIGGVQRFFDNVTVPFGFTTRYNTRVQCAWILIVAGCSWGHVSLFHEKAEKREEVVYD